VQSHESRQPTPWLIFDVRQKKDEILALNFLTKEDKTNKEKN